MQRSLLIATGSAEDEAGLFQAFSNLEEIRLLDSVTNGKDAIDRILAYDVNILLLDLFMPYADGIDVLEFIDRVSAARKPAVFLMTPFSDDRLLNALRDKIAYCFTKPLNYEIVQLRVLQLMNAALQRRTQSADRIGILEKQIAAGIRAIGIPAHLKGYYYLREAIRIYALCDSPQEISITNTIYPLVAETFHTKPMLVEHAIRNAIEIAWMRGNLDTLHDYFGYTVNDYRGKPSNHEFIAMMAERALSYVNVR